MPRVGRKGQVTIPRRIRLALGIHAGDEVIFQVDEAGVIVKKKEPSIESLKAYAGFLSHLRGRTSDKIMDELRGDPDEIGG